MAIGRVVEVSGGAAGKTLKQKRSGHVREGYVAPGRLENKSGGSKESQGGGQQKREENIKDLLDSLVGSCKTQTNRALRNTGIRKQPRVGGKRPAVKRPISWKSPPPGRDHSIEKNGFKPAGVLKGGKGWDSDIIWPSVEPNPSPGGRGLVGAGGSEKKKKNPELPGSRYGDEPADFENGEGGKGRIMKNWSFGR